MPSFSPTYYPSYIPTNGPQGDDVVLNESPEKNEETESIFFYDYNEEEVENDEQEEGEEISEREVAIYNEGHKSRALAKWWCFFYPTLLKLHGCEDA